MPWQWDKIHVRGGRGGEQSAIWECCNKLGMYSGTSV